jgi:hypothetical protein
MLLAKEAGANASNATKPLLLILITLGIANGVNLTRRKI